MPRQARLDAPGVLHHVMVRGIEGRRIFHDDADRADFCARLASLAAAGALTVYAWALLPNHAHLLVRTRGRPLARGMRSLLTGYAGAFNRRHKRRGHLFQNRYKSIVVEEDPYLLELVRYLHLNPLRAGIVQDLRALDRYPWTGHSALLGQVARPWQQITMILAQFGSAPARARRAYRVFVAAGIFLGRRPELQGGGLVRSLGGWEVVKELRRGREAYAGDERILGSAAFVEHLREGAPSFPRVPGPRVALQTLVTQVCQSTGASPEALQRGRRQAGIAKAREGIAYLAVEVHGYSATALVSLLGVHPPSIYKAAQRGRREHARWAALRGKR